MTFTPTSTPLADAPPRHSILEAAHPITDLPGITPTNWVYGVNLWWRHDFASRFPNRVQLTDPAFADPDIAAIADPDEWPDAITVDEGGQTVYSAPGGWKADAPEPDRTVFRTFWVYAPRVRHDLGQSAHEPGDDAEAIFLAHADLQVAREYADGLYSKNPSLYRIANDQSAGGPVHPAVAIATLYEAFGNADDGPLATGVQNPPAPTAQPNGSGDMMLSVPYHAIPILARDNLVGLDSSGRLVDCYGNLVGTNPGWILNGPLVDTNDLETSVDPTDGDGWFYLGPRPFAAVGQWRTVDGMRGNGPRGSWAYSNEAVDLVEAPALVVFRPARTYAVKASLNLALG